MYLIIIITMTIVTIIIIIIIIIIDLQKVRVKVTPVWQLTTPQASVALLELPSEDTPDQEATAAALAACRQPHAQVCPPLLCVHKQSGMTWGFCQLARDARCACQKLLICMPKHCAIMLHYSLMRIPKVINLHAKALCCHAML